MMNIKEAGRYSNFLKANIDKLQEILEDEDMVYKVKEEHYKSRALKDVEDEIRTEEPSLEYDFKVEDSLYLLNELVEEKMRLSMRINDAKEKMRVDWKEDGQSLSLDSALEYSKNLREMARDYFESLCYKRSEEYIKNGLGYLINQEGNQTPYNYEIKVVKTINYDRDVVKKLYKKTLNKADMISQMIDELMLQKTVDFQGRYDIYDSLEDVMQKFKSQN